MRKKARAAFGVAGFFSHLPFFPTLSQFVSNPKNVVVFDDIGVYLARKSLCWFYKMCKCMIIMLDATPIGHTHTLRLKYLHQVSRGNPGALGRLTRVQEQGGAQEPLARAQALAAAAPAEGFPTEREIEVALGVGDEIRGSAEDNEESGLAEVADINADLEEDSSEGTSSEGASSQGTPSQGSPSQGSPSQGTSRDPPRNSLTWFALVSANFCYLPPGRGMDDALVQEVTLKLEALARVSPDILAGHTPRVAAIDALRRAPSVFVVTVPDPDAKPDFALPTMASEWKDNVLQERVSAVDGIIKLTADVAAGLGLGARGVVLANSPDVVKACRAQVKAPPSPFNDDNTALTDGNTRPEGRKNNIVACQERSRVDGLGWIFLTTGAAGVGFDGGFGCVSIIAHPLYLPSAIVQAARRVRGYGAVFIVLREGSVDGVVLARAAAIGQNMGIIRSMCVNLEAAWVNVRVVAMIRREVV